MKLEELVKLKEDAVIRCGACGCQDEEYLIEMSMLDSCGCYDICHSNSGTPLAFIQCATHYRKDRYINVESNKPFITLENGAVACWNAVAPSERDSIVLVKEVD